MVVADIGFINFDCLVHFGIPTEHCRVNTPNTAGASKLVSVCEQYLFTINVNVGKFAFRDNEIEL